MAQVIASPNRPTIQRSFWMVLVGQIVSVMGSQLTSFGLGLWVLQTTGSVTPFALTFLATLLPSLLLSPVAGALVDRWNRRTVMLLSDTGSALGTLLIWALLTQGVLHPWMIYLVAALQATLGVFQSPAYAAAVPLMVPSGQIGRVNGVIQGGQALALLLTPLLASALLPLVGLSGIVLIDLATFLFAVLTMLSVQIPMTPRDTSTPDQPSLGLSITQGLRYILARPGLLGLIVFFGFSNFLAGMVQVLIQPLMLSFVDVTTMGLLLTFSTSGMLISSVLISVWGGPQRQGWALLVAHLLAVLAIMLMGFGQSALVVAVGAFVVYSCMPVISSADRSILNRKVELHMQGRVFALSNMLAATTMPLGYVLAGPLADLVFRPLLLPGGTLSAWLGPLFGVGAARGIGLMLALLGALAPAPESEPSP